MRKLILVVHISLDGFVAGINGELTGFDSGSENLEFVCQLTEDADTALFGRISYELLNRYWPTAHTNPNATKGEIDYSNWYNNARKIVVSRTLKTTNDPKTTLISNDMVTGISAIKKEPGRNILIFGSPSVSQQLIAAGLVDSYWVFINPVIFGNGIPLFRTLPEMIKLSLLSSKHFPNGEMALNFIANE